MHGNRREFLIATAAGITAIPTFLSAAQKRPRIAALTTTYYKYSHSEHIIDRFLEGYGWNGSHHRPEMDIVSLYVEQVGDNDLSRERASRHPQMKIYPTIAEALTLGGDKLAVDGVLLIAEHGKFPVNEKGQMLYPRYEYFQQIMKVYRDSGRVAPIFNDKHLSWNWDYALEMYEASRKMNFGFMAGSSLPCSWRQPSQELPANADVEEAVAIFSGWMEGGDFHVFEALQSIVERRRGGESGIKSVEAYRGDRFWTALAAGAWEKGGWDSKLLEACLSRSNQLRSPRDTYSHVLPTLEDFKRIAPDSFAYRFEYQDGLKASVVQFKAGPNQPGPIVGDCSVAARLKGGDQFSVLFYLPYYTTRNFFSPQVHHIESLFLTGKSPYPLERTLLTTGMTASAMESLFQQQKRIETPHLAIKYQSTPESTFRRS